MKGSQTQGVRKAKAEQTVLALKEAAKKLFAERGYLNTKITDILSEAGRSAGVFYDHFASKEELLEALVADFQADAADRAAAMDCAADEHDLSDRAQLRAHIEVFWHTYTAHLPVMVAMFQASMVDEGMTAGFGEWLNTNMLHQHLEHLNKRGVPLAGDSALLASALSSMLLQFAYVWLATGGRAPGGTGARLAPSADEAIDMLTSLIHNGIVARD